MDGFVWLDDERRDGTGLRWPDSSLDGFWAADALVLRSDTLLARGIGPQLWSAEFEAVPTPTLDGFQGRARLFAQITGWSASTAGELRLHLFQLVRASVAKALVSAQDENRLDPFERDIILDMVGLGRKVAGARGPSELRPVLPSLKDLVGRLWPPERKKKFGGKAKVDVSSVYENFRSSFESILDATTSCVEATMDMDSVHGVNRVLAVLGKLGRAEANFTAMLDIQAMSDQAQIDAAMEVTRAKIRSIRDLQVLEPGTGEHEERTISSPSPFAQAGAGLQQATGAPITIPQASTVVETVEGGTEFPAIMIEATSWLQTRMQIR